MNKRILGFAIAILAIIGGVFASFNLFLPKEKGPVINEKEAAGFAASFISSYFTYSNEAMFEPITYYTSLADIRRAPQNLIKQEVISSETIDVQQLQNNYIKAKVLLNMRANVKKQDDFTEKIVIVRKTYLASVRLLKEENGYRVVQYPSLHPFEKSEKSEPPYPSKTNDDVINAMKPMILSFCRTFFIADTPSDISNYFVPSASVPEPLKNNLEFIRLERIDAYGKTPWLVYAVVRAKDKATEMEFNMSLEMFVTQKNDRYLIEDFIF